MALTGESFAGSSGAELGMTDFAWEGYLPAKPGGRKSKFRYPSSSQQLSQDTVHRVVWPFRIQFLTGKLPDLRKKEAPQCLCV